MRVRHINLSLYGLDKEQAKEWCLKWPTVRQAFVELKNPKETKFEACKVLSKADPRFPFSKWFRNFRFEMYYIHGIPGSDKSTIFTRGGPIVGRGKREHILMTQTYHVKNSEGGEWNDSLRREFSDEAESFIKKNPGTYKLVVVKDWMVDGLFTAHLMKPGMSDQEILDDLKYSGCDGTSEILAILEVDARYKSYQGMSKIGFKNDNQFIHLRMKETDKHVFWKWNEQS